MRDYEDTFGLSSFLNGRYRDHADEARCFDIVDAAMDKLVLSERPDKQEAFEAFSIFAMKGWGHIRHAGRASLYSPYVILDKVEAMSLRRYRVEMRLVDGRFDRLEIREEEVAP